MHCPCRLVPFAALSALAFALGCAGPPIPAPIEGLPVCPDFTTGGAKMEGGLRYPVRLRVLDGKTVLYKTVISGLRRPDEPPPKTYIADDNAHYQVEWGQCQNPRAPRSASDRERSTKTHEKPRESENVAYDCGEATVYKSEVLTTRKRDRASHVITFVPPPNAACWEGEVAPAATPLAADAGAPASDAGAPSDAGATDAGGASR
jgi:hypothetical protein